MTPAGTGRPRRARLLAGWGAVWLALTVMTTTWALGTPLMSSPDEPSHAVKAVAVVRGELLGDIGPRPTDWTLPGAMTTVQIPSDYAVAADLTCFVRNAATGDASCQREVPDASTGDVDALTAAGHYPPLYYVLVGWPSLLLPADVGFWAMRVVSGALSASFLTVGLMALRRLSGRRVLLWGAAAAVTPMCLFLAGSINPNGLEISTAFALWSVCLALGDTRTRGSRTVLWVAAAVCAVVLVNIRALAPLWAAVAIGIAVAVAEPEVRRRALRSRAALVTAVAVALGMATSLAWTVRNGALLTGENIWPQYEDRLRAVVDMVGAGGAQLRQIIGDFGWLDTPPPPLTVVLLTVAAGALIALALAVPGHVVGRLALATLLVGTMVGPMILQMPNVADAGLVWQGRYTLPITVGAPLVAAVLLLRSRSAGVAELLGRAAALAVPAVAVGHVVGYYWASRRYAVGLEGPVLTWQPAWESPVGFLPGVGIHAAAATVLVVLAVRGAREDREVVDAPVPDARFVAAQPMPHGTSAQPGASVRGVR